MSFLGKQHTEEAKERISTIRKKNPTKYWLGKKMGPMDQEQKDKISKALRGKNNWNSSRVVTEETKKKMSESALRSGNRPPVRRGADNNMWKGGITEKNQAIRTSAEYKRWRDSIFERDDYTCQMCNEKGVKLRANHIKRFADFETLRMVPYNGITICEECDLKFVLNRERDWEIYFYNNLIDRGLMDQPFGYEVLLDCYKCDPKTMNDTVLCEEFLNSAVETLGVHKQADPIVIVTPEEYEDKSGLSAWCALVESGIQCHTLTVKNFVSIDYYTCSRIDEKVSRDLIELTKQFFSPKKIDRQVVLRGINYYNE